MRRPLGALALNLTLAMAMTAGTSPPNASTRCATSAELQGGANADHRGDPALDTADFTDGSGSPGNLRADYVLPSRRRLDVRGGAVFWPRSDDPWFPPVGSFPCPSSDHRLTYVDLAV